MVKTYGKILLECNIPHRDYADSPMETTYEMLNGLVRDMKSSDMLDKWITLIELAEIGLAQNINISLPETELEDADNERADINIEECSYLSVPVNCETCFALGYNGICGYCKFTTQVYAEEKDLMDDNRLKDCPFRQKG